MISANPLGPSIPGGGWKIALADDFNVPFGSGANQNNMWHLNRDYMTTASNNAGGFNGIEVEVFNSSAVSQANSVCSLTATYSNDVAPATGNGSGSDTSNYVQRNYISGCITTAPVGDNSPGFLWMPDQGDYWAFQCVCQWPRNIANEMWWAFWSAGPVDGWEQERDFVETYPSGQGAIDSDWIWNTGDDPGGLEQDWYTTTIGSFDPSCGFHTYTYYIMPNQSWQLYIDGALQTWVGSSGTGPSRTSTDVLMQVMLNYSLKINSWTTGSQVLAVDSVAVYTTGTNYQGGGLATGTVIGQPVGPNSATLIGL